MRLAIGWGRNGVPVRRIVGGALLVVAFGSGIIFAGWALILELRLLYEIGGALFTVVGFLVLPFTIPLGAVFAGIAYGYWTPLLLVVALVILTAVGALGVAVLGKQIPAVRRDHGVTRGN